MIEIYITEDHHGIPRLGDIPSAARRRRSYSLSLSIYICMYVCIYIYIYR